MVHFDLENVSRIAQDAAREHSPAVKVIGVVLSEGGSDYVEVLVELEGCHEQPCRFSLGVFRNASATTVKDAISEQLQRHVEQRPGARNRGC